MPQPSAADRLRRIGEAAELTGLTPRAIRYSQELGLGATFLTIMWVLLGYLLITTALVPVVGRLADMVGRKRLYVAGFAVFTLGSLLARGSRSLNSMAGTWSSTASSRASVEPC